MNPPAPADFADLAAAVKLLRAGGVVAFPTETVYGLGAEAFNEAAVRRVFQIKGRPSTNPLIVHVAGPAMAQRVAASWPADAARLASAFWPGPLSIVLPKRPEVPDIVAGGAGAATVAVRCPDHPTALALLYELGQPLVGPSANTSGGISPTTAQHVRDSFPDDDLLILDGGACSTGIESTVVSLVHDTPRILRAGVLSADDLAAALGRPVLPADHLVHAADAPLPSPGLLARHYAPRMTTRLLAREALVDDLAAHPAGPARVVIGRTIEGVVAPHALIPMPYAPAEYAAVLYAALRHAEEQEPAEILIEAPPTDHPTWLAIHDRLRRASTP